MRIQQDIAPTNLERIHNYCLTGCSNLVSVNFNNKLKYVGDYVFSNCQKLESINIPKQENDIFVGDCIFKDCKNITEIDILNWEMSKIERKEF